MTYSTKFPREYIFFGRNSRFLICLLCNLLLTLSIRDATALVFTNTPNKSWRYAELIENSPNGTTYFPTSTNEYTAAGFNGFVTEEEDGIYGPLIIKSSGNAGYQIFTTWAMSPTNKTLNLVFNGDDGHSLFVDGQFMGGGGFGVAVSNSVLFSANVPRKIELADYNSGGGWGIYLSLIHI